MIHKSGRGAKFLGIDDVCVFAEEVEVEQVRLTALDVATKVCCFFRDHLPEVTVDELSSLYSDRTAQAYIIVKNKTCS